MGWGGPGLFFLEKRGGPKENFTMIGGGSLCVPDQPALPEFKYLSVHTSSNNDENGKKRIPDDWQPRSNIKKLFEEEKLSINASDAITARIFLQVHCRRKTGEELH